jgi:hypothetical protein
MDMKKQPVEMSIRQYVDNPAGKGSAYLAKRSTIKQGMNVTFVKLLQRYRQQFFAVPYIYPNGDILFHVKVPSEEYDINKITYDVLFMVYAEEKTQRYSQRRMKVFSNSPGFLYTYAYVYYHRDMIISDPDFVSKLPQIALSQPPVVRNPIESLGYEKSTYVGARYLLDGFVLNDSYINRFGKKMNPIEEKRLLVSVANPELLVKLYAHARDLQVKEPRRKVDQRTKQSREKLRQQYISKERANKPKKTGFVFKRAPQSKITAKKAKRRLFND